MTTRIAVQRRGGRHQVRLVGGLLRPQLLRADEDGCRIGLLATTALLLGGDEVDLEIEVGPGATLDLFDVAATVAYHGRGRPAAWRTQVVVAEGATFAYAGEPLIVADGADVLRSTRLEVAAGARAELRETLVLGRSGEVGGPLRSRTHVRVGGRDAWLEDQVLDVERGRCWPGILGDFRVLDTLITLGDPPAGDGAAGVSRFTLPDGVGVVTRYLGHSLACSPLAVRPGRPAAALRR